LTTSSQGRGIQQQQSLRAVEAEDNASGVRSFNATFEDDEEESKRERFAKRRKGEKEEHASAHFSYGNSYYNSYGKGVKAGP